jgi:hypothetical protein
LEHSGSQEVSAWLPVLRWLGLTRHSVLVPAMRFPLLDWVWWQSAIASDARLGWIMPAPEPCKRLDLAWPYCPLRRKRLQPS